MKEITKYFRKAILAQVSKSIDFKNNKFYTITKEQLLSGNISREITNKIFEDNEVGKDKDEKEIISQNMNIIIVPKTIKTRIELNQRIDEESEDLTGIYFIPAMLNKEKSCLLRTESLEKFAWFPREYLAPMIEPELAIGDSEKVDNYISDNIDELYKAISWEEYLSLNIGMYENVTNCKFEDNVIKNLNKNQENIELDDKIYIFIDNILIPTISIQKLYTDILENNEVLPLYEKFVSMKEEKTEELIENTFESMQLHKGQMNGEYPISKSQREALNHFEKMENGDILAVNGPPGTGKTTLIQSIVANMYVTNALNKKDAPVIIATSTNNQAVTNIIESFGNIKKVLDSNLENRWINKVNSFATYFPSKHKIKEAELKQYQYTNNRGDYFIGKIENDKNIEESKVTFTENCMKYFKEKNNLTGYKELIYNQLVEIENIKNKLLSICIKLSKYSTNDIYDYISDLKKEKNQLRIQIQECKERFQQWIDYYNKLPIIYKLLQFIKPIQRKVSNRLKIFCDENENTLSTDILNFDKVEIYFADVIRNKNTKMVEINTKIQQIQELINKFKELSKILSEDYKITLNDTIINNIDSLNANIDTTIRYMQFWLAVHYYEAEWLQNTYSLTEKQKGTVYKNVVKNLYKRLSMLTPCLVMTFYMLPKQFNVYDENKNGYLYNFIDLLIVDEAGQVSPEIAACSFALAKKAVVVGDVNQIEPVWSINRSLDKSLALQEKIIKTQNDFKYLEELGLTSSSSNVMQVSCKCTKYMKYDKKGLFLSEHRRCLDNIIQYCNELVYNGKLNPLRGNDILDSDGNIREKILPEMGYYQINTKYSQRIGTSRINENEAYNIANWIKLNYNKLQHYYNKNDIIGIITPFKEQAIVIKKFLKKIVNKDIYQHILVGTIHTFQGAERNIVIFSSTYGSDDGCAFIDYKKSLMNVAVSRAKDSFLIFGDINCLSGKNNSPSGLLNKYVIHSKI